MAMDYSLYLVTDSTPAILGAKDIAWVVEEAIKGGVTLVQYRDKNSETGELIETASRLREVTRRLSVPFIINDRLDVAQAVEADGLHIGQDDMQLKTARRILGKDAVIGVTVSSPEEAIEAARDGASYLGIGTVHATPTKIDTKSIIGTAGVRSILEKLAVGGFQIPAVAIGSINASNIQRVLYQSASLNHSLSGVAVVSAVMAAADPQVAARQLSQLIAGVPKSLSPLADQHATVETLLPKVPSVIRSLGEVSPLCHNMTNLVVQNFAANVAICIGASPIMANSGEEARDLASLGGSLVINMGTVMPDGLANYKQALQAYNEIGGPVLFDPVGAGATGPRRNAVKTLMQAGFFDVVKGNENEILTVLGSSTIQQKGVDSGASTSDEQAKAKTVTSLARRERNIVLMTGKTDFLSDGSRTFAIENGHEYLGHITGSGCTLGTTIASCLAVEKGDRLLAALAGILMYEIAAEVAGEKAEVKGPGTFVPSFLDSLYAIAKANEKGDDVWVRRARVRRLVADVT